MYWTIASVLLLLVCIAEMTWVIVSTRRLDRVTEAALGAVEGQVAELRARVVNAEHGAHMALMAHAGLGTVSYGYGDETVMAAFPADNGHEVQRMTGDGAGCCS